MHGEVGFTSVPGEGSSFWVDIPTHGAVTLATERPQVSEGQSGHLGGEERRLVLYVEDNPADVVFLKDLLGAVDNIELGSASSAEIGIAIAKSRRPDVLIMDINLPGMSGVEALRVLRSAPETEAIPVIALTAAASERDRQRGLQAGFFRYLTKPVKV